MNSISAILLYYLTATGGILLIHRYLRHALPLVMSWSPPVSVAELAEANTTGIVAVVAKRANAVFTDLRM